MVKSGHWKSYVAHIMLVLTVISSVEAHYKDHGTPLTSGIETMAPNHFHKPPCTDETTHHKPPKPTTSCTEETTHHKPPKPTSCTDETTHHKPPKPTTTSCTD